MLREKYTEQEYDRIVDLFDRLPAMFYGEWGNWEESVIELSNIIYRAQRRQFESTLTYVKDENGNDVEQQIEGFTFKLIESAKSYG